MLICLKPGKNKNRCENRMCNKRLIGQFKILRRGTGYNFHVCLSCFNGIVKKGGPDKYLPGRQNLVGEDKSTGVPLHDATEKPYIPVGTHKLDGEIKIAVNNRTGQIML